MLKTSVIADDRLPIAWNWMSIGVIIFLTAYAAFYIHKRLIHIELGGWTDFHVFYDASQAIMHGSHLYESGKGGYIYPPFFAFLLLPFAHLSFSTANIIMIIIDAVLMIAVVPYGVKAFASSLQVNFDAWQTLKLSLIAVLLTFDQILSVLLMTQSDAIVVAALILALFFIKRRPYVAGILLGMAGLIKYQTLILLPLLLFRRCWKASTGVVLGALAAMFLPAFIIGWHLNWEYLHIALRGLLNMDQNTSLMSAGYVAHVPSITWASNFSITSGMVRFFQSIGIPKSYVLIPLSIIVAGIFIFLRQTFHRFKISFPLRRFDNIFYLEWCVLLICLLILSPQCIKRHTVILLNVNILIAIMLMFPRPGVSRRPLIMGTFLWQMGYFLGLWFPKTFWFVLGGPMWMLLVFLFIFVSAALEYYQVNLFRLQSGDRVEARSAVGRIES